MFSMHLAYYPIQLSSFRIMENRDFPGGPMVRTLHFTVEATASIPDRVTKILYGAAKKKKKKKKNRIMENTFYD